MIAWPPLNVPETADPQSEAVRVMPVSSVSRGPDAPRPSLWRRLRALDERINDCWIGDLLGIASLVALVVCTPVLLPMFIIIFGGTP